MWQKLLFKLLDFEQFESFRRTASNRPLQELSNNSRRVLRQFHCSRHTFSWSYGRLQNQSDARLFFNCAQEKLAFQFDESMIETESKQNSSHHPQAGVYVWKVIRVHQTHYFKHKTRFKKWKFSLFKTKYSSIYVPLICLMCAHT